jgi:hypothetical protein
LAETIRRKSAWFKAWPLSAQDQAAWKDRSSVCLSTINRIWKDEGAKSYPLAQSDKDLLASVRQAVEPFREPLKQPDAAKPQVPPQHEITFAQVVERYDVPFSALSKATNLPATDPNHLASRKEGRNRKVDADVAGKWCSNYLARRDARQRHRLARDPKQIRMALRGLRDSQRNKAR